MGLSSCIAHGRVRIEVGRTKPERVPTKENRVPIGGIGPKKKSMAKIGKRQKRAPETLR